MWLLTTFLPEVLGEITRSACVFFHLPCGFSSKSINLCLYLLNCFGHTIYSEFLFVHKGLILSSRPRAPNMYGPALGRCNGRSTPSALSRNLRLLHHRPRARCTAGGHARPRRCLLRRTTRSRRRSSPRHQRCPRSPHRRTRRAFRRRLRRTRQWPLGLLRRALAPGCASPRGLLRLGTSSATEQPAPSARRRPAAGTWPLQWSRARDTPSWWIFFFRGG